MMLMMMIMMMIILMMLLLMMRRRMMVVVVLQVVNAFFGQGNRIYMVAGSLLASDIRLATARVQVSDGLPPWRWASLDAAGGGYG